MLVTERMRPRDGRRRASVHQVGLPYHWGQRGLTTGDSANDLAAPGARPERPHPGGEGVHVRHPARPPARAGPQLVEFVRATCAAGRDEEKRSTATDGSTPERDAGFFTDTSICIGCKACEVACKEWNLIPEDGLDWTGESYDNTVGARREHVAARRVRRAAKPA